MKIKLLRFALHRHHFGNLGPNHNAAELSSLCCLCSCRKQWPWLRMYPQFFCIAPDAMWLLSLGYLSLQYLLLTISLLVSRLGVGQMELQITKAINFEIFVCRGRKICKETAEKQYGIVSSRIPGTNCTGCMWQEWNHGKAENELLFTSWGSTSAIFLQ